MASGPALGIDFGTSSTVGVLRRADGSVRPLLFDGTPLLPSAVYLESSGQLLTGRDAIHAARLDPTRFEPSPKRHIGEDTVLLGGTEVTTIALAAAVLRRVAVEATRVNGTAVREVTLTHPATWAGPRRDALVQAARRAGLPRPRLVAEPVAAASYFTEVLGHRIPASSAVVVYDFGAGTFDASAVLRGPHGFDTAVVDGLELGGLDIDAAIVDWLGTRYGPTDPAGWQRLSAPTGTADRRAREQLWTDVRACKEQLSRSSSAQLAVPVLEVDAHLTRDELERLALPLVEQTVTATADVVRAADLTPKQIVGVFLVGGGSRLPLAASVLHRRLGIASTAIEQPELVVAEGSLRSPESDGANATRILPALGNAARSAGAVGPNAMMHPAAGAGHLPAGQPIPAAPQSPAPPSSLAAQPSTPTSPVAGPPSPVAGPPSPVGAPAATAPSPAHPAPARSAVTQPRRYSVGSQTPAPSAPSVTPSPRYSPGARTPAPTSPAPAPSVTPSPRYAAGSQTPASTAPSVTPSPRYSPGAQPPASTAASVAPSPRYSPGSQTPAPPAPAQPAPSATPSTAPQRSSAGGNRSGTPERGARGRTPTRPVTSGRSANGAGGRAYWSRRGRTRQAVLAGVLVLLLAGGGLAAWYGYQRATAYLGSGDGDPASASDGRPGFVPADWQVAVRSLDAQNGWHDNPGASASCRLHSGILTATRTDSTSTGMFSCGGPRTHYRNVALDTTVQVQAGCAGIWLRTGDLHGYFVEVCPDSVTLHLVEDTDPSSDTALHPSWPLTRSATGRSIRIGVLAIDDTITVYADGEKLGGPVENDKITTGRLDLGVFAPHQDATAVFTRARAWRPANST
jgi:actin-like ATPase involved in cell morphogenesis